MPEPVDDAHKYLRRSISAGGDQKRMEFAAKRYEKARQGFDSFQANAKVSISALGLGLVQWQKLMNLAKQIYGFSRRWEGDVLAEAVARAGAEQVRDGFTVDQVMAAVRASYQALGLGVDKADALAETIAALVSQAPKSEVCPREEPVADSGSEATEPGPADEPEPEERISLTKAELAERVQKYLKGRLEEGDAGSIAADLAEEVAKMPAKKRKAGARRAVPTSRLVSESATATEVDNFSQRRLVQALRGALAPFQPLVRRCVALRLWEHRSFDELAEDLGISRDDVADILTKLRPYVRRFTNYFDQDWYWVDGGKKYFIPQG